MKIISYQLVNFVVSETMENLYSFRKGKNRDYLIKILKSFLIEKGKILTYKGEDITIEEYKKILRKSVEDRLLVLIPKGLSKKIILKLLDRSLRKLKWTLI